ncbi:MAG: RNase adapter RapZ [Rhodospirillales bacterium]|nr:RNase adapter RapZ [Rhodospirillales bacterium]MBO6785400.1 RNase adapter RapZ [Rhodospirillales bacterium]
MTDNATNRNRVLLVSGVSGAGKSSALKLLEDIGFEAVDNMPLSLIGRLIPGLDGNDASSGDNQPLAIGVDIRTRDFDAGRLLALLDQIEATSNTDVSLLFIDCDDEVLGRRYEETRRRHPLAADRPVIDGIRRERRVMEPLRARADYVIDTTDFALGDLKAHLEHSFGIEDDPGLAIFVTSFSFKRGLPRDADLVFDVRFFRNPHYDKTLRPLTGRDADVQTFISKDDAFSGFIEHLTGMVGPLLPRYRAEGKSYLTIAFGCTGGRHRSVFIAERFHAWLKENGWRAQIRHRDLDKA